MLGTVERHVRTQSLNKQEGIGGEQLRKGQFPGVHNFPKNDGFQGEGEAHTGQ